jgi:surface antigen
LPVTASIMEADDPLPRQPRATVTIYVEATPPPVPPVRPIAASAPLRAASARMASSAPSWVVSPASSAANGFSYGYCTWWVAHKRYIPWRGNAYQWWWNARSFGFAEGPTPRAGAVMVMGISGSSPQGHVAYVESVNPGGTFLVSEMNWWGVPSGGWNRVDYRTVTSMAGVLGFIY